MQKFLKRSLEETNVDKVYKEEHGSESSSESDNLSNDVQALIDENQKQDNDDGTLKEDTLESDELNDEDTQSDTPLETEEPDTQTDGSSENDVNAAGGSDVIEASTEMVLDSVHLALSIENLVDGQKDGLDRVIAQEDVSDTMRKAAAYLKDIGLNYGPGLLKALGRGLIYLYGMTLKGLSKSLLALDKTIQQSVYSYSRLNRRIQNIEKTLEILSQNNLKEAAKGEYYEKEAVINSVFAGHSFDPLPSLAAYQIFLKDYVSQNTKKVNSSLTSIRNLAGQIQSQRIRFPENLMSEPVAAEGLVNTQVKGYRPINDFSEVYHYPKPLPGNIIFMAYLPKKDLSDPQEIYEAYRASQFFFGKNLDNFAGFEKVPYLTTDQIKTLVKSLKEISAWGPSYLQSLKSMKEVKKSIGFNLRSIAISLSKQKDHDADSLMVAKFIALKIYFVQKCYTRGMVDLEEMNRRILFNYTRYIEASLLKIADQSKKKKESEPA